MGWQDAPLIEGQSADKKKNKWESAPLASEAAQQQGQRKTSIAGDMLNAATRMATKAVTAPPLLAMDLGVALRNVGGNLGRKALGMEQTPDYELPSRQFEREVLDRYTTPPSEFAGKAAEFAGSVVAGAGMPSPAVGNLPKNFQGVVTPLQQTLEAGQRAGLTVPPATVRPTILNQTLETIGGKIGTAQDASVKNQAVLNELARKAIGAGDEALTPELLNGIRAQAGKAYDELRGVGEIVADTKYADELAKIAATTRGAAKSFPGLASNELDDIVNTMSRKSFDSSDAVDAMSILRDKASKAYANGDAALGKAYRSISNALEGAVERSLKGDLLSRFRDARQLMAKTYSIEDALNPATGNIVGSKLASQFGSGRPLTEELLNAARFSKAFPKATREAIDSGAVRNTDLVVGGGTAALSGQPWYLLYPFARQAARAGMLSPGGQSALTQAPAPMGAGGIFPGAVAAEELKNLLGY